MNKNGYFFLTTPEIGTPLSNWSLGKTPWFFPPEHLHILSPTCIINVAKKYNLELVTNGHFEISRARYFIRYFFFGLGEAILGVIFYLISKKLYFKIKSNRFSTYKGIQYMVFKKSGS